jgi:hypothetical protein
MTRAPFSIQRAKCGEQSVETFRTRQDERSVHEIRTGNDIEGKIY